MDAYRSQIRSFLVAALNEDIAHGDITTELTVPEEHVSEAAVIAKDDFVLAGLPFVREVFALVDARIGFVEAVSDGSPVLKGSVIATLKGSTRGLLAGERLALNILQRLSGIATLTSRFVELVSGTGACIVDTRKTTPNMRYLEKYAVRMGGGNNHRFGLYDGILIKDNHIKAAGGIRRAIERTRGKVHHLMKIEVEVSTIEELAEAIQAGADIIMLDNMPVEVMREAVATARTYSPTPLLEASGGVSIDNVREIALTGVDLISVGALTHSAPSVDISMKIV
ncbi:MAG: carboxylating nicotinate-nucleotide diphosphorylase [Nitrospirae bacterium]|nr:carboxylating nicotinate-nucleotide diphosphorylase [Nitrospirota bacterium]